MEDSIELGGSIELKGFSNIGKAEMIVIKKIVGNYAKEISEKAKGFSKLTLCLNRGDNIFVTAEVLAGDCIACKDEGSNLFVVMDNALKKVMQEI